MIDQKEDSGDKTLYRGSWALGSAALGAIGADVLNRARSRYLDGQESMTSSSSGIISNFDDDTEERNYKVTAQRPTG